MYFSFAASRQAGSKSAMRSIKASGVLADGSFTASASAKSYATDSSVLFPANTFMDIKKSFY
nr:MAG TPA: hypothetical protein [Caudoviricetes sp.]